MWRWHKFVSLGVLAIIALTPFVSLWGLCSSQPADTMQCPADCPMMAKMMMAKMKTHHSGLNVNADQSGSCCNIQRSTPAPNATATVAPPIASVEPATVSSPLVAAITSHIQTIAADSSPPPPDSQARLCTFLI